MQQPLVSIIIPNHNYAQYLSASIQSALDQSYPSVEVIVVDDGSTDDSRLVIESFGSRIRTIYQENQGQTAANNAGFAEARGEVLLFLDSDDALHPEAVAEVVRALRPGVTSVQFCVATIDAAGHALGGILPPLPRDWTPARIRQTLLHSGFYPFPPASGNAYTRSFLEPLMPIDQQRFHRATDGLWNSVAPLYGDVIVLPEPLGYYRIHGANAGALNAMDVDRFSYFLELDRQRWTFLIEHALRTGVALPADILDRAFFHLQYRLASLKLAPKNHPYPGDRLLPVVRRLLRAAYAAPEPPLTRALIALWAIIVVMAPRPIASSLISMRFVGGANRPVVVDLVLRHLGLVRRLDDRRAALAGQDARGEPIGALASVSRDMAMNDEPGRLRSWSGDRIASLLIESIRRWVQRADKPKVTVAQIDYFARGRHRNWQ
jgi:glycosyltransferase involved in cell wall biosynthesis